MRIGDPYLVIDHRTTERRTEAPLDPVVILKASGVDTLSGRMQIEIKNLVGNFGIASDFNPNDKRFGDHETEGVVDFPAEGGTVKLLLLTKERMTEDVLAALEGYDQNFYWHDAPLDDVYARIRDCCLETHPL